MMEIKNILICGLGGVGCVCATSIYENKNVTLKILVDEKRLKKYIKQQTTFNGKKYNFEYIIPKEYKFKADLIIIATKDDGLSSAIKNIENFIKPETIIISLLNGIHSENKIKEKYKSIYVPISFYIGDSCIRNERNIEMKGTYNIFIGDKDNTNIDKLNKLSLFFKECNISHKISNHIQERYWKKFMVNVGLNQICTANNLTFKEVKQTPQLVAEMKELIQEVKILAKKEGINNPEELYTDTMNFLINEFENATPSMLQDIRAGRKTEVEILAGEVVRLGKKHNIKTPQNEKIYEQIKILEEK